MTHAASSTASAAETQSERLGGSSAMAAGAPMTNSANAAGQLLQRISKNRPKELAGGEAAKPVISAQIDNVTTIRKSAGGRRRRARLERGGATFRSPT